MASWAGLRRRASAGMSVLEVLIATALLGVLALVISAAFVIGLRGWSLAARMNTALNLAEESLTKASASPCGELLHSAVQVQPDDNQFKGYRYSVDVSPIPGLSLLALRTSVTWQQERRQRTVTLTTQRHISAGCELVGR